VARSLPYMATESVLMEAVAKGGDRQALHERIRIHSHAVTEALKAGASQNDLLNRLGSDPAFAAVDFRRLEDQKAFVGRAPQQVEEFIAEIVEPIRQRYRRLGTQTADVTV
jgi:adenylosuccinate lyase